jgi:hypothetical protein
MEEDLSLNSFEDFVGRFDELSRLASEYGITAVVLLHGNDPLSHSSVFHRSSLGEPVLQVGMLQHAIWQMQANAFSGA